MFKFPLSEDEVLYVKDQADEYFSRYAVSQSIENRAMKVWKRKNKDVIEKIFSRDKRDSNIDDTAIEYLIGSYFQESFSSVLHARIFRTGIRLALGCGHSGYHSKRHFTLLVEFPGEKQQAYSKIEKMFPLYLGKYNTKYITTLNRSNKETS